MKAKIGIITALAVILAAGAYSLYGRDSKPVAPASALLKPANAEAIRAAVQALKSPLVMINFWASWCEPCKQEFPSILALREKLKDKGFNVVFVSIDEPRDFQAAEDFLKEHHVDFQTYYKGYNDLNVVSQIYPKWEGAVPTSLLIGPKLDILDAWEGDATAAEFEKRILAKLGGK